MRPLLPLMLVSFAIAGCGGDGDSSGSDKDAIFRSVNAANEAFAQGDYSRACSHYVLAIRRQLAAGAQVKTCPEAWAAIDATLRRSLTPSEFDALTSYGLESAEVEGDTATGAYGEPPASINGRLGIRSGATIQLRKVDGRWLIASLPAS